MNPQVQSDIGKLLNYSVEFAETLLVESGEYYPFGFKICSSGEFIPEEESPESQKIINGLTTAFEETLTKKEVIAYCIAYDVRVKNEKYSSPKDAILVSIKHKDVEGKLTYYYPYELGNQKELEFLEPWEEHVN